MVNNNILSIGTLPMHDNTIIKKEFYPYVPYTTTFNESDEIRIAIQSQDSYLLPCESYLFIQIGATTAGLHGPTDAGIKFINNFPAYLFSDARYELNNTEIDRNRSVGRSSTMKLRVASPSSQILGYQSYCKTMTETVPRNAEELIFDIVLPLQIIFGFCEDYRKIILNCKHELILNRARQSLDLTAGGGALATSAIVGISVKKIIWKMPHITLADPIKLKMLNYLSKNRNIHISFRSMDLVVFPELPQSTSHIFVHDHF